MGKNSIALAILALLAPQLAAAATLTATVVDQDGHPVPNAVVALFPEAKAAMPAPASHLTAEKTIDQQHETFIPLVTVVPKGGRIVFANNDTTTHQVYSFSAIKQFEMTLARGEKSAPVSFDASGVAALGCNIHDHMIAYAYVAESPWTAITGADGHVTLQDVPAGGYDAQLWHPQLPPSRDRPVAHVAVSGDAAKVSFTVTLLPPPGMRMAHSHAGNY